MLSFQKLDVYQRASEFFALSADISVDVPRGHADLLGQLRRAAYSVTLNIAEAAGRVAPGDKSHQYAVARGSAMECAACLDALVILKVTTPEQHRRGVDLLERIVSMLTRLCGL